MLSQWRSEYVLQGLSSRHIAVIMLVLTSVDLHSVFHGIIPSTAIILNDVPVVKKSERYNRDAGSGTGFKSVWVTQCGVTREKPDDRDVVEVMATTAVPDQAHIKASRLVFLMLRSMSRQHFAQISGAAIIGVFGHNESITVLPDLIHAQDTPKCEGSCKGSCKKTCTFDGRKYKTLAGLMYANTVAVREDTIMCDVMENPYHGKMNVLVHELAHGVMRKAVGAYYRNKIRYLFKETKHLWKKGSYAMSNSEEFWATASEAFFATNIRKATSGGINMCGDNVVCTEEWQSRANIREKSQKLFDLLNEIYTDSRTYSEGRISTCVW